jgi:hypothetical protein
VNSRPSSDRSRVWQTSYAIHLDVRGLAPPEPMVAILRLIDGGEVENVLIAHLDREPVFLYPELDERGWAHEIISARESQIGEQDVQLRIARRIP